MLDVYPLSALRLVILSDSTEHMPDLIAALRKRRADDRRSESFKLPPFNEAFRGNTRFIAAPAGENARPRNF